jgi:uncharacterized protein involved in exopolysaccharide biosynthesis
MQSRWVREPLRRRGILVVAAIVLAFFCVWPRPYLARAQLMPDNSGGGLASLLGQTGGGGALASLGALIGGRQSIESDLTIARSLDVAADAASRMRQEGWLHAGPRNEPGPDRDVAALRHKADIEVVRGGILQVTVVDHRADYAKALVAAYTQAIRSKLAALNVEIAEQKKAIAANQMAQATVNLARAQTELDRFRLANRLAEPQIELGSAISIVTSLEARLAAQEAELAILQKFATSENIEVQAARAQVEALKGQIAAAEATANGDPGTSVGQMRPKISEYENLYRNEKYAEAEYEIFKRYLDTVTVEQLSAGTDMNVVEPPYLDPDRQFNEHALAALFLLILVGVLAEFYIQRPPVGGVVREAL